MPSRIKWVPLTRRGRPHAIFIIDAMCQAIFKDYDKLIHGIDCKVKNYRQFNNARWMGEADRKRIIGFLENAIGKRPSFISRLAESYEKAGNKIFFEVDANKKRNWKNIKNQELSDFIEKIADLLSRLWGGPVIYSWYFYLNDQYLPKFQKKLSSTLSAEDFTVVWDYLMSPQKLSLIVRERLSVLKIALDCTKGKFNLDNRINSHLNKYAYSEKYFFWGEGMKLPAVKNKISSLLKLGPDKIKEQINGLKIKRFDLSGIRLSKSDLQIIHGFQEMAYAMNFVDESINYFTYHMRPLLDEICRRLKISYNGLAQMSIEEIIISLKVGNLMIDRKELKDRISDNAYICENGKIKILSGIKLSEYKAIEISASSILNTKELKGTVAFAGPLIKGVVRMVRNSRQIRQFKKGEVLVTEMTNPTLLPAMQKASAIVTDEGGLLCHAAIVSRELKIPCIVGAKIATKLLRDGDLVKVDTQRGVVGKIKDSA